MAVYPRARDQVVAKSSSPFEVESGDILIMQDPGQCKTHSSGSFQMGLWLQALSPGSCTAGMS